MGEALVSGVDVLGELGGSLLGPLCFLAALTIWSMASWYRGLDLGISMWITEEGAAVPVSEEMLSLALFPHDIKVKKLDNLRFFLILDSSLSSSGMPVPGAFTELLEALCLSAVALASYYFSCALATEVNASESLVDTSSSTRQLLLMSDRNFAEVSIAV